MKKSLIALAALAVVSAASAQTSSLTISGYIDRGYTDTNNNNNTKSTRAISSSAGTTAVFIKGTEDLGNGTSAGFLIETDWAEFGGATQSASVRPAQAAGFANGESFLSLANAQIGTLKLGAPSSFTLGNVTGVASPAFSTGVGSVYSKFFSIANGISTGVDTYGGTASSVVGSTTGNGARSIRMGNAIQYVSPMFSGFSAGVAYAAQNNNATTSSGNTNTVGMTEYALNYANGPVVAAFTSIQYKVGSNGVNQYNVLTSGSAFVTTVTSSSAGTTVATANSTPIAGNLTSTQNMLGGSYQVLPELKLHAGFGTFSSSDNSTKGSSTQVGVTYVIGAVDLMAQYAKVNDTSSTNIDRKMFGLGANYNLSKTARLYARYDDLKLNDNGATVTSSTLGDRIKRTAVGVSKSF